MGTPSAKEVFAEAVEKSAPERSAYLAQVCGGDVALRRRVEALLRLHDGHGDFLASPTADESSPAAASHAEGPGGRIGPYKLLQLLGEGGFGSVFMAEQEQPLRRRVALKIIKLGMDTRQVVARFEQERQALALMDHPNIARVLDAGATDSGRPYFVMDLVKGDPITQYCDRNNLSLDERLELFAEVCSAVQHAHTKGVIHRDIKPSNVLVATHDGRAHAKVIDFGIAKATAGKLTEKTLFTEHRQLIGTPEYMSPEQAEGSLDIDTRTDVYSLGVLLYELLTGTTPFDAKSLRAAGYGEILRVIREEEPPKPSTRLVQSSDTLASVAAHRHTEPKRLGALVRGELDWIVMKALEKDRQRRYETASALAADIRHHLTGEAVVAAPPSAVYRLQKFVHRNRGPVLAAALVVLALVLGLAGTLWKADEARREAERANMEALAAQTAEAEQRRLAESEAEARVESDKARAFAESIEAFVTEALQSSDPVSGGEQGMLVTDAMQLAVDKLDAGAFEDQPEVEMRLRLTVANILMGHGKSSAALPLAERALAIHRQLNSGDDLWTAQCLVTVCRLLSDLGRHHEAEPLAEEALEMCRWLGDDGWVACCLQALGSNRVALGRVAEAEPLYEEALVINRRLNKGDDQSVCTAMVNLAFLKAGLHRYFEAEALLVEALAMFRRLFDGDHPEVATCMDNLSVVRSALGHNAEALALTEEAYAMTRRLYQGDHPRIAVGLVNLAGAYRKSGRLADAEPLLVQSLEMHRRLYGNDHPRVFWSMESLARVLEDLGRPAEAEPLLQEALEWEEQRYEGDNPEIAMTLAALATVRALLGHPAEAEQLILRSLAMLQRIYPGGDLLVARALDRLAVVRGDLGRPAEAEELFRQALEMFQRIHDGDHADIALTLASLANVLCSLDRRPEAAQLLEQAVAMHRRLVQDGDDRNLAMALVGLSDVQLNMGRLSAAERSAEEAVAMERRLWKIDHPNLATALRQLASVRRAQRRLGEAEPLLTESLGMLERTLGRDHPANAPVLAELGGVRVDMGRLAEAEPLLVRALEMLHAHPDDERGRALALALRALGDLRLASGYPEQAEPLLREALGLMRKLFPGDSPVLAQVLHNLASSLSRLGQEAEARKRYREALEMGRRLHSGDDPDLAACLQNFGAFEQEAGHLNDAESLLTQALEMRRRLFPGDSAEVAQSLGSLARLRGQQGRSKDAEPLYVEALEMLDRLHAPDQLDIALRLNNLGQLYWSSQRAEKAEPLFARGLEMLERLSDGDSNLKTITLMNLGCARWSLGRLAEAEAILLRGMEMNARLLAREQPENVAELRANEVALLTNLALLRLQAKREGEAVPLLTQVVKLCERDPSSDPAETIGLRKALVEALEGLGRRDEALEQRRALLACQRELLPAGSREWSAEMSAFGSKLLEAGTTEAAAEALPLLRECLAIRERVYPAEDVQAWYRYSAMSLLGAALSTLGQFSEAEPLLLGAHAGLKDDARVPPPTQLGGNDVKRQNLERITRLYESWNAAEPEPGRASEAEKWRAQLEASEAGSK